MKTSFYRKTGITTCTILLFIILNASGQDYVLNVLDTTTYTTTCGYVTYGFWGVKNDSCLLYTPFLMPADVSADSVSISFKVRINQTGNLELSDHAYIYTQTNIAGDWVLTKMFQGMDYVYVHTYDGSIKIATTDSFRLIICLENNSPNEWWQIKDGYPLIPGVTYRDGDPMPVELTYFKANSESPFIHLQWATASETNNDYFSIEKSDNSIDFDELVQIDGAGNSNSLKEYSYTDNIQAGSVYYRLKQTDFDGQYTYSETIAVNSGSDQLPEVQINQDGQFINVIAESKEQGKMQLNIYSMLGQLVFTNTESVEEGENSCFFMTYIQPGSNYILSVSINNELPFVEKHFMN